MTAPGRYAASDNSFTTSTATAATRGAILVAIAIVIGVLLLLQGFDGGEATVTPPDDGDESGDDIETEETTPEHTTGGGPDPISTEDTTPTTTEAIPIVVDPPNSVKVAVLNGRGETGLAGTRSDHLKTAGYVSIAANAVSNDQESSRVLYTPGYSDEAELVAVALNGLPSFIERAPADPLSLVAESYREAATGYHIYVVLGEDGILG